MVLGEKHGTNYLPCTYSRNGILVISDIGCRNMCGRDRDTGDTDRNKGYRII